MQIAALRIAIAVVWLTAFMWLRFTAASNITLSIASRSIGEHSLRDPNLHRISEKRSPSFSHSPLRELQSLLRRESTSGKAVECCPTIEEMIEPTGGRNRQGAGVELYRHLETTQRFHEYSCRPDVLDKPCRFVDRRLMNQTRCVQKFSYSYAIVGDPSEVHKWKIDRREHPHRHKDHHKEVLFLGSGSPWRLDHIRVRSGCSCQVFPKPLKKKSTGVKSKKENKKKSKIRKARDEDFS